MVKAVAHTVAAVVLVAALLIVAAACAICYAIILLPQCRHVINPKILLAKNYRRYIIFGPKWLLKGSGWYQCTLCRKRPLYYKGLFYVK